MRLACSARSNIVHDISLNTVWPLVKKGTFNWINICIVFDSCRDKIVLTIRVWENILKPPSAQVSEDIQGMLSKWNVAANHRSSAVFFKSAYIGSK